MGQYTNKGLYNKYDRNNKERDALDYYSTPTEEVENILNVLEINFSNQTILEPCVGGGHMMEGIKNYIIKNDFNDVQLLGSDIKYRGYGDNDEENSIRVITGKNAPTYSEILEYNLDFMADDYPYETSDYVVMNPPYSIIEPFTIRALEIAKKGVLMLARLQFLEGQKRYDNILKNNPPTDVYVYVDRIACYKNGDFSIKQNSAQAYAWFYWDKQKSTKETTLHWIRNAEKEGK